jgi:hypothetical protein
MNETTTQITCPQCGFRFNAGEALEKQIHARMEQEFERRATRQAETLHQQQVLLERDRQALKQHQEEQELHFAQRLEQEKQKLATALEARALERFEQELQSLRQENETRKQENLQLRKQEIELQRREHSLQDQQEQLELTLQKKLLDEQSGIEARVRKTEQEKVELRFREYEKKLEDQKKLIEEMKRKAEQGSMQMQGEVLELALEDLLGSLFPFDRIAEVPKGVRGADVIQVVFNSVQQECGKIIYESKRTRAFGRDWIEKLKADQREQGADLAVIVTEAMPADMDRFGQRDGVWICNFHELQGLAFVLREMLLRTRLARAAQENKGDKMEMLYEYLTGTEFRQRVEAIVEGFTGLKTELDRERNAMQRIWKAREKQIEKIIHNTIDMYGSVRGIAGASVGSIPLLELPEPDGD